MPPIAVDGITFEFPRAWEVTKADEWSYYRHRFSRMGNGIKSVDLIAIDPEHCVWFIEAKDYRVFPRTKTLDLASEVSLKVIHSLAALLPARITGDVDEEVAFATKVLAGRTRKIRVVLHLEQPRRHSKLFPRAIEPADVQQALRRCLKPIDPHVFVSERTAMGSLDWETR